MKSFSRLIPVLLVLCHCSSGQWEPSTNVPLDGQPNQQWYSNSLGLVWSSGALKKYEDRAPVLLFQQFGGGFEATIQPIEAPIGQSTVTIGDMEIVVPLRPLSFQIVLQPEDNTIALQVDFDAVNWVAPVDGLLETCSAAIHVPSFVVRMVFEPGRDVAGNITASMVAEPTSVDGVQLKVQWSGCEIEDLPSLSSGVDDAFRTSVADTVTSPSIASGFEQLISRFFGLGLATSFRAETQQHPVDPGRVDVRFESMSADGDDPSVVVGANNVVLPLGSTLSWTNGACVGALTQSTYSPPSIPAIALEELAVDTDGVLILRQDFIEQWIHAAGAAGLWCQSRGFDGPSGLVLEQMKGLINPIDIAPLGGDSLVSIRARIEELPTVDWISSNGEVSLDLTFPALSVSFYARLWNTDWLLYRETWTIKMSGATVGVEPTGSRSLRLEGGTLHVENKEGNVDSEAAEVVLSTLSDQWTVIPLPDVLPMPIEPVRWTQGEGYLKMHFNLMTETVWEPKHQDNPVDFEPIAVSTQPNGCGVSLSQFNAGSVLLLIVLGFFWLFRRRRKTGLAV